ncbi:MAG: hypothetical protein OEZ22_08205 [Spirochaetia bacterium]|nr:hypothetical protein [Spirochaetia bacterium]
MKIKYTKKILQLIIFTLFIITCAGKDTFLDLVVPEVVDARYPPTCGDFNVQTFNDEECDKGKIDTPYCDADCTMPWCGDGHLNETIRNVLSTNGLETHLDGEQCDPDVYDIKVDIYTGQVTINYKAEGVDDSEDCNYNCTPAMCKDSIINHASGETCDDSNDILGDGCDADCVAEECGNGVHQVQNAEQCDDGSNTDGDGCENDCTITKPASCGDGVVDAGEACDGSGQTFNCNANCTVASCGDGYINVNRGEACETPNIDTASCNKDCTAVFCGDMYENNAAGEQCEDGKHCTDGTACYSNDQCTGIGDGTCLLRNNDGCDINCYTEICGNGVVQVHLNEECDDGNDTANDECSTNCKWGDEYEDDDTEATAKSITINDTPQIRSLGESFDNQGNVIEDAYDYIQFEITDTTLVYEIKINNGIYIYTYKDEGGAVVEIPMYEESTAINIAMQLYQWDVPSTSFIPFGSPTTGKKIIKPYKFSTPGTYMIQVTDPILADGDPNTERDSDFKKLYDYQISLKSYDPALITSASFIPDTLTTVGEVKWYAKDALQNSEYFIAWQDSYDHDGSAPTADINVSAYKDTTMEPYFYLADHGYNYTRRFFPAADGKIYIRVQGYYGVSTGSYSIKAAETNVYWDNLTNVDCTGICPTLIDVNNTTYTNMLTNFSYSNTWIRLNETTTPPVSAKYLILWNDVSEGNYTKSANVLLSAYNLSGTPYADTYTSMPFERINNGYTQGQIIEATSASDIILKAEPYFIDGSEMLSSPDGSFDVISYYWPPTTLEAVYNTTNTTDFPVNAIIIKEKLSPDFSTNNIYWYEIQLNSNIKIDVYDQNDLSGNDPNYNNYTDIRIFGYDKYNGNMLFSSDTPDGYTITAASLTPDPAAVDPKAVILRVERAVNVTGKYELRITKLN